MSVSKLEIEIQRLLDGTISDADFVRLRQRLESDPDARRMYYRYVRLHQSLEMSYGGVVNMPSMGEARLERRWMQYRRLATWAAVAVLIFGVVMLRSMYMGPAERLSYEVSPGGRLELRHPDGRRMESGEMAVGSEMTVMQGAVELQFGSRVTGWVSGPARLVVVDDHTLRLGYGEGRFHVAEGGEGFTVETEEFRAVDLGTEFGVRANRDAADELHVFSGLVAYELVGPEAVSGELAGGEALRSVDGEVIALTADDAGFSCELPDSLRYAHWSFDSARPEGSLVRDERIHQWMERGGDLSLEDGVRGQALALERGGNGALLTNWDGILGDAPRTLAFWVKLPPNSAQMPDSKSMILGWGRQQPLGTDDVLINSKWAVTLRYQPGNPIAITATFGGVWYTSPVPQLEDAQWHHVAVVYEGGQTGSEAPDVDVYIDGILAPAVYTAYPNEQLDAAGHVRVNTESFAPLRVGGGLDTQWPFEVDASMRFTGWIDELFVIEGALSQRELWRLKNEHCYRP